MLKMKLAVAMLLSVSGVSSASALGVVGEVSDISGQVVIERGGEFLSAVEGSGIVAGDTVFALGDASASLNVGEDCAPLELNALTSVALAEKSATSCGLSAQHSVVEAANIPAGAYGSNLAAGSLKAFLIFLGSAAAVAVVVESFDDDDSSASP